MRKPERYEFNSYKEYELASKNYEQQKGKQMLKSAITYSVSGVAALVALTILGGSWYTVDQGERGVLLRNGAIQGVAEPGLGFKMPLVDRVVDIDVRSQAKIYEGVLTYSRDQQTASLVVSVNYRVPIDQVESVYANYGSVDSLA